MFCQSCTMPIDNMNDRGTEKDNSKSNEYCKYCYQHGEFINPGMSLDEMKTVITTQMQKMNLPENIIKLSLDSLPHLKRWKLQGKVADGLVL
jgi:Putative zinc ribbon domain